MRGPARRALERRNIEANGDKSIGGISPNIRPQTGRDLPFAPTVAGRPTASYMSHDGEVPEWSNGTVS